MHGGGDMAGHESRNISFAGLACEPCKQDMHGPFGAASVTNRLPMAVPGVTRELSRRLEAKGRYVAEQRTAGFRAYFIFIIAS
jgi:hypothetical protein